MEPGESILGILKKGSLTYLVEKLSSLAIVAVNVIDRGITPWAPTCMG